MEITAVETVELTDIDLDEVGWVGPESQPHERLLFVRVHTDDGLVGLGETYPRPTTDAELIHSEIAPDMVGRDPHDVEEIWQDTYRAANGWGGFGGSEMRALSALDIALWDLKGQDLGAPIHDLLGGRVRDSMPTYNTCYEGEYSFLEEPAELAESLLEEGIEAMKIWPYDGVAHETGGEYVGPSGLERGAEPVRKIREAVGDRMDVAMELHGLWNLPSAKRIAEHLEEYGLLWLEEPIEIGDLETYQRISEAVDVPVIVSERLMSKFQFNTLLRTVDVDYVMFDPNHVGGLTESKKVAALAEAYQVPIAPHNCSGPVTHFANLHLGACVPNLAIMESVRGRYDGWHRDMITVPATASDGRLEVPDGPGLGTELSEEVLSAPNATIRRTER
jgi:L-alanine-DL-glutamate epimerase-like enolase superfamily enzyme